MNRLIPGRSCPLSYRYEPSVFVRTPEFRAETIYIVGGLYGNEQALDVVAEMCGSEPEAVLVFNGDFNWFNAESESFVAVNRRVLEHHATRGNVETEIAAVDEQAGCGCAYPEWVGDAEVERSNRIMTRLRAMARKVPDISLALAALPMHLVAEIGASRVAISSRWPAGILRRSMRTMRLGAPGLQGRWPVRMSALWRVATLAYRLPCRWRSMGASAP